MIERCAKAICKSGRFETGQGTCSLLCMDQLGSSRQDCRHAARLHGELAKSIIKAMREPTDKMIEAGACVSTQMVNDCKGNHEIDKAVYQAMIDAVINEH